MGAGTNDAALIGGGTSSPESGKTETWNGSSWTEVADLSTARFDIAGMGTQSTALGAGGETPGPTSSNAAEEWSVPSDANVAQIGQMWFNTASQTLKGMGVSAPAGAGSSGGSVNSARYSCQGFGSQTAALLGGGNPAPNSALTELYDGSSWTETADQNTTGKIYRLATGTVQTAGLYMGGEPTTAAVEEWDGSSWTEIADFNTGTFKAGGAGSTTAALKYGGTDPRIANTESFDGTSWTEVNDLNNNTREMGSAGTQTAA